MNREKELVKNTFILSIGTFLPKLVSFVTLPILTAYLTKEEYGTYDLITVLVSLVLPAATLQIQTAAFRFLVDSRENEERIASIITNILFFIVPLSLFVLGILYLVLPGNGLMRVCICLYFLTDILLNACRQVARGLKKNLDYSISAVVSAIGKMLFAIVLVWLFKLGLLGAIASLLMASLIALFVLIIRLDLKRAIDFHLFNFAIIRELLSYSWPMVPNSMSMWVMRVSDRFVVTSFLGLAANGVYAVANKIPSILTLAQSTFTMAWHENASMASKDEDSGTYYSKVFRTMFDLTAGLLALLICATPVLFAIFIRGDYSEAYLQLPFLFLGMFFYSQSTFLGGIYVAYKDTKSVGITTIAAAAFNFLVDLMLIKEIGLYAASISTMISYLFLFLFRAFDVRKLVNIAFDFYHIFIVVLVLIFESFLFYKKAIAADLFNVLLGIALFVFLNKKLLIKSFYEARDKITKKNFHFSKKHLEK